MASLHSSAATFVAADANVELGREGPHRGKVDLEPLGRPHELDMTSTIRTARRQAHVDLPIQSANRSHAVAVGVAASASRSCRLLLGVSLGEGRRALAPTTGLRQEPLQLRDAGDALRETLLQFGDLGGVAFEQLSQTGNLVGQLLVGVALCARGSVFSWNFLRNARALLGGGPCYPGACKPAQRLSDAGGRMTLYRSETDSGRQELCSLW